MTDEPLSLDVQLKRAIVPLIAVTEEAIWHPVGTAFVVAVCRLSTAPGAANEIDGSAALLLTAAHNLREWLRLDTRPSPRATSTPADFLPTPPRSIEVKSTRLYAGVEGPKEFVLAEVLKSWYQNEMDVAVVLARIPSGRPAKFTGRFAIDPSPVAVGTELAAIGYAGMAAESAPDYERGIYSVQFTKRIEVRHGSVIAVHSEGIGIYKWPGFIVGCPFDSGMSGGPLVDHSKSVPIVRGVICGDLSDNPDDGRSGSGAHAFASVLWPALGTPLVDAQLQNSAGETVAIKSLIDLISHKAIDDRGDSLAHFQRDNTDPGYAVWWI